MASPVKRPATYDDLLRVPSHQVAEIVDGELHVQPRPAFRHARAATSLERQVGVPFDDGLDGPGGWWILFEPELHLGEDVLVPDIAGWKRARMPEIPDVAASSLAPDWVCEVLSPNTGGFDRASKMPVYAREGVNHLWLVNPMDRTLEVFRLIDGRWTVLSTHQGDALFRAEPFDEVELKLGSLWVGPPTS